VRISICVSGRGQLEADAVFVVQPLRGVEIEIGERDFARVPRRHIVESLTYDRVVSDFKLVAVFEDEGGWIRRRLGSGRIGAGLLRGAC